MPFFFGVSSSSLWVLISLKKWNIFSKILHLEIIIVQGRKIMIRSTIKKKFLNDGKKILNSYLSSDISALVNLPFLSLFVHIFFYIKNNIKITEKN